MKNGKATGHGQILTELIKEGGKGLKKVIYKHTLKIWEEKIIPQEWKYGIKSPVHKKGDVTISDNYRAVTLLCTSCNILAYI
jgi:hypothetical protein